MQKYLYYLLLLLTGTINGYILIVLAGITYPMSLNVWIINLMVEYDIPHVWRYLIILIQALHLTLVGIPIFLLSSYLINRYIKLTPFIMAVISTLGTILFLSVVSILFSAGLISYLTDIFIASILSIFTIIKVSKKMATVRTV